MARIKVDYGIDLGTTNSAICRMEKGEPVVIKSDVLKDTMPSCVSFTKNNSVRAGDSAVNDLKQQKKNALRLGAKFKGYNACAEFKRTMATNTRYHSSHMARDYSSEELSAEVLKALKSFVTDENVASAVITVPAKFTVNQKTATLEAAQMAGFRQCELLQEPIAAAMAYGLTAESKNGTWMVFDFGGGTFDAALVRVEDGIIQVFDTEGDNYLGGKNLDYAIVDSLLIPYLMNNYDIGSTMADANKKESLREVMKTYAEDAKIQLSFKDKEDILSNLGELGEDDEGEEIELDLTVTQEEAFDVMRPHYQRAVDICKNLLQRNHLSGTQIDKLILVGGPTHCPLIRQMLREEITPHVDTSIDPMTAVATGAALYASTIDADVSEKDIEAGTVTFEMEYAATSVETTEFVSIKLAAHSPLPRAWVELVRSDKAWTSGKVEVDGAGNVVEASLLESKPNSFEVRAYDERGNLLPSFPSEFTIIQGTAVGAAPLPYNIGIARWSEAKRRGVFCMAKGAEKNRPIPATGVVHDLKTTSQLRPGIESDVLTIPVCQVDDFSEAEGRTASLYEHVADVVITGDDVDQLIPADSLVDVTLKVAGSEQMTLEVHFLASDITVEKKLDTSRKHSVEEAEALTGKLLGEARQSIGRLAESGITDAEIEGELDRVEEEVRNSSEKKAVLENLKRVLRKIERLEDSTEWQRVEAELREEFDRLEKAQGKLGNEKTAQIVAQLRQQTDQAVRGKNAAVGREVLEQVRHLFVHLTMLYQCMALIQHYHERFGAVRWKDSSRARQLLNRGLEEINGQPTTEKLHPIACGIIELLPRDETANAEGLLK